jgi:uncharacterized membrane protein YphA (DoxX/SURF4 family)
MNNSALESFGLLLGRLSLGAYFALAGWAKIDAVGVAAFADQNLADAEAYLPDWLARPFLMGLPYAELAAGAALALGLLTRISALAIAVLLASFIAGKTGLACSLGGGPPFHDNAVFLGLAILLVCCGGGRFGLDGRVIGGGSRRKSGAPAPRRA